LQRNAITIAITKVIATRVKEFVFVMLYLLEDFVIFLNAKTIVQHPKITEFANTTMMELLYNVNVLKVGKEMIVKQV
jgi:hypothetical protein